MTCSYIPIITTLYINNFLIFLFFLVPIRPSCPMSVNDRFRIYLFHCTIPTTTILYYKRGGRKLHRYRYKLNATRILCTWERVHYKHQRRRVRATWLMHFCLFFLFPIFLHFPFSTPFMTPDLFIVVWDKAPSHLYQMLHCLLPPYLALDITINQ